MKKILLMCVSLLCSIAGFSETIIQFEDQNAKNICVQNWDTNGDGELSQEEAAAVTDIGGVFTAQKDLRSFSEFQYFTGVTAIPAYAFQGCYYLSSIIVPENVSTISNEAFEWCERLVSINIPAKVTSLGNRLFSGCYSMAFITSGMENPTASDDTFLGLSTSSVKLFVPVGSKSKYKNTIGWSSFINIKEGNPTVTKSGDLYYLYDTTAKAASVISGNYTSLNSITISESISIDNEQYAVTTISKGAFYGCYDTEVISIPNSVTTIEEYAFFNAGIKSLTLPSSLKTIANLAFANCYYLTHVSIPEGVLSIGNSVFAYCEKLQKLELPSSLASIGDEVVDRCYSLVAVISHSDNPCPIGESVFGQYVWDENSQTGSYEPSSAALYIPSGSKDKYKAIKGWTMFKAIEEGDVKEATVDGLKYTYYSSGQATVIPGDYQNLKSVTVPGTVTINNSQYQVTAIGSGAFNGCYNIRTVNLPEGITEIGNSAFCNVYFTEINLPSTLKSIGNDAFKYCNDLVSISIPEGVTSIGDYVFRNCQNLQKIELPNSLNRMGNRIIQNCQSLTAIISHIEKPFYIPDEMFAKDWTWQNGEQIFTPYDATLYVPVGTKALYEAIKGWTVFKAIEEGEIKEAKIGDLYYTYSTGSKTATVINGDYSQISDLIIPSTIIVGNTTCNVTAIAPKAFYGFSNIRSVKISDGVTSIGADAFYNVRMDWVELPTTLETIGARAFCYCYYLSYLNIPEGVTTVGDYAFYNCNNLQTIVLPSTLNSIGNRAFGNNSMSLSTVISRIKNPFKINDYTFGYTEWDEATQKSYLKPSPAVLYVPDGTSAAYKSFSGWTMFKTIEEGGVKEVEIDGLRYRYFSSTKTADVVSGNYYELTEVTVPGSIVVGDVTYQVTDISLNAFGNTRNLKSITLSEGITNIGKAAFTYSAITSITLPSSLRLIDANAFQDCNQLSSIDIPEGVTTIGASVFYGCSNLSKIVLPNTLTSIGNNVLGYNSSVTAVVSHIKEPFDIPNNVFGVSQWDEESQKSVYNPCNATLYVPEGTKALYEQIEGWTKFKEIKEGEVMEAVVDGIKYSYQPSSNKATVIRGDYENLESVTIPGTVKIGDATYQVAEISMRAFSDLKNLKTVTIGEGITAIPDNTFSNSGITQLTLPSTLKSIGNDAFHYCRHLTSVVIPDGVETIGDYSFSNCFKLQSIELPATLKSVGSGVFSWSCALSSIVAHGAEPAEASKTALAWSYYVKDEEIFKPYSNAVLFVPSGSKDKYKAATGWSVMEVIEESTPKQTVDGNLKYLYSEDSKFAMVIRDDYSKLENISVPASITINGEQYPVTAIGGYAFGMEYEDKETSVLKSVTLSEGITSLGVWSFAYAPLSSINLPSTLKTIYGEAFTGSDLTSVTIPGNVELIDNYAFTGNSKLTSVVISEGVKVLSYGLFSSCDQLQTLELPSTLIYLGGDLVRNSNNMTKVISNMTDPIEIELEVFGSRQTWNSSLGRYDFTACPATLFVPNGTLSKYQSIEGWTLFKNMVELGGTEAITIGKSGKASYCGDKSLDFSFSDEVKAYIATGFDKDEGTIWLTRVKDVPAGVPVLIKGNANTTYDVPVTDSENSYYTNMFVGNTSGEKIQIQETDGDMVNYYLSGDGTFKSVNKTANIGTNKCYLQLPGTFEAAATGATQTVKVGSIGKASFAAPVDLDFTNVSGLKAFTATGYDKSTKTIWLTRVMKVQKGEGVLLKGDPNSYEIPSAAVQSSYENMFVGNTSGNEIQVQETSEDGSQTNYYLKGDGSFVSVKGYVNIKNNKCYLALPTSMVAVSSTRSAEDDYKFEEPEVIKLPIEFKSIGSEGDGTTGVKEVKSGEVKSDEWFTLQGQRVAKPGKGLYIRNGKVVIVR